MYSIETSKTYTDIFGSLLIFNNDSELIDLTAENLSLRSKCHDLQPYINICFKRNSPHIDSTLKSKIKLWNECLDEELYECMQGNKKMSPLRELADQISSGKKTEILRKKLIEKKMDNPKLIVALKRMDIVIQRIINAKSHERIVPEKIYSGFSSHQLKPLFSKINSISPPRFEFMKKALGSSHVKITKNEGIPVSRQSLYDLGEMFGAIDNYSELISRFNALTTLEEVQVASVNLDDRQSSFLIFHTFDDDQAWKLPVFLASISFITFNALLLQLDEDILNKTNFRLKGSNEISLDWINKQSLRVLQSFMEACNELKVEIDYLAGQFRCKIKWCEITSETLQSIQTLDDICRLNLMAVKNLSLVFAGIATNPNFLMGIEELVHEYELFIGRLNDTPPSSEVGGGIINIIILSAFADDFARESGQKESDVIQEILEQDSYYALGLWNLTDPDSYRSLGILGDLTDDEYKTLLEDSYNPHKINPYNANCLLHINLKRLGIECIGDFVKKRIFNQNLLREYLKRNEVGKILNDDNTPLNELWNSPAVEDLVEQMQKLGWATLADMRKHKVFTPAMLKIYLDKQVNFR